MINSVKWNKSKLSTIVILNEAFGEFNFSEICGEVKNLMQRIWEY